MKNLTNTIKNIATQKLASAFSQLRESIQENDEDANVSAAESNEVFEEMNTAQPLKASNYKVVLLCLLVHCYNRSIDSRRSCDSPNARSYRRNSYSSFV